MYSGFALLEKFREYCQQNRILPWDGTKQRFNSVFCTSNQIYTRSTASGISSDNAERETVKESVVQQLKKSKSPLIVFPEGATTNGNGLLLFQKFTFSLGEEILPVGMFKLEIFANSYIWTALKVYPYFEQFPINFDHLTDSVFSNVFAIMFCPMLVYEYTFLPSTFQGKGETPEDFASRVQESIAAELKVPATRYSYKDKQNLRKNWNPY
jgi:hypothetical protein